MSDASVPLLTRQSGLLETTQIIANNIANASTPGFKSEGTIFSEYIKSGGKSFPSISMGELSGRSIDFSSGAIRQTGGTFDLALPNEGFFKVLTPQGERLTRAGAFLLNEEGVMTDVNGYSVLDDSGGEVQFLPGAKSISIAEDGTISVDGEVFGVIGVYEPLGEMRRAGFNLWQSEEGDQLIEQPTVIQGALEQSNVDPVAELAQLIYAQRLFEAGQGVVEQENDRLSKLINALRQEG